MKTFTLFCSFLFFTLSLSLYAQPFKHIEEVIDRLESIEKELNKNDGVWHFNHLYLATTRNIAMAINGQRFNNPQFLELLDIRFAELYLKAYDASVKKNHTIPLAWRPLFRFRYHQKISGLRFALSGMNAHINRDLALATLLSIEELGLSFKKGTSEHLDYLLVNQIIYETEQQVKKEYLLGGLSVADDFLGQWDDKTSIWAISVMRDLAWQNGWALKNPQTRPLKLYLLDKSAQSISLAILF